MGHGERRGLVGLIGTVGELVAYRAAVAVMTAALALVARRARS